MKFTPHYVTADEAVRLIRSGDSVFVQGSTSIPEILVAAMTRRAPELRGVKVYSAFAVARADAPYARAELRDSFEPVSFFVANNLRKAIDEGVAQTLPCFLGEVPSLFRQGLVHLDATLLNVSEPDEEGYCSFGVSADLATSAAECSKAVIAQVNKHMPRTFGDSVIHITQIDALVRGDDPLVELPTAVPNEIERSIGNNIAALVPDGATLQIGVGGIPNAVLDALHDHKHLGLHTEAMTDGVVPLIEKGIIDNSLKAVLPGKSVASLALGSRRLYDFMHNNRDIVMKDVAWTNDPFRIRLNPRVMAINSALEVDLTGQICADSIGTRIFSGVGGQHDFMYGGALSEGGKCFIAMQSATAKGRTKIVPELTLGAGVVTTRFQTQYVVTEYGAAFLRDKNLAERARALIDIAHPEAREGLERAACERFGTGFLRLKRTTV